MQKNCLICERIRMIQEDTNPYFVKELQEGYVVIGDHQFYRGYTLFLYKEHAEELHELKEGKRRTFLYEMSIVAEAVWRAFKPVKLNYELLGNTDPHLHWHIIPRHRNDPDPKKPTWYVDEHIRKGDAVRPTKAELDSLRASLLNELNQLIDFFQNMD